MPVIIAATDFTDVAENAVIYACDLASANGAEIVVMHTYSVPILFSDMPIPSPLMDTEALVEKSMSELVEKLKLHYPALSIRGEVIYGNIIDGIEEYIEKNGEPILVVAGNAYTAEHPAWVDSVLLQAIKNIKAPLLAIPEGATYTTLKNVCFAFDNKYEGSDIALLQLKQLISFLKADLHVVMAQTDPTSPDFINDVNPQAKILLDEVNSQYQIIYGHDPDEAIRDYAAQYNIDCLVVIPRKHSFWEGLFHKSHTEMMVNSMQTPLIALHDN